MSPFFREKKLRGPQEWGEVGVRIGRISDHIMGIGDNKGWG